MGSKAAPIEDHDAVKRRYDLMGDEEIAEVLGKWMSQLETSGSVDGVDAAESQMVDSASSRTIGIASAHSNGSSSASHQQDPLSNSTGETSTTNPSDSPLFPPSPPSGDVILPADLVLNQKQSDHPLRTLARAVKELQETVENLRVENEGLRRDLSHTSRGRNRMNGKVDTVSNSSPGNQKSKS
jgi:hypothetical protein